jgi:OOP family OmpA-OmpF porin
VEPAAVEPAAVEPGVVTPTLVETITPVLPMPTKMIQFAFDSADLSAEELKDLQQWAAYLSDSDITEVEIHGHADNIGTEQYNQDLSARRAQVTANMLRELVNSELTIKEFAHGELEPLTVNKDEASRRLNRRVEINLPKTGNTTATLSPAVNSES